MKKRSIGLVVNLSDTPPLFFFLRTSGKWHEGAPWDGSIPSVITWRPLLRFSEFLENINLMPECQSRATSGSCKLVDLRTWGKLLQAKVNQIVSRMMALHDSNIGWHLLSLHHPGSASLGWKGVQRNPCLSLGNWRLAVMRLRSITYIAKTNKKNDSKLSNLADLTDFSFQIKASKQDSHRKCKTHENSNYNLF